MADATVGVVLAEPVADSPGQPSSGPGHSHPKSASTIWTGIAGLVAGAAMASVIADWLQPTWLKALAVLATAAAAMVVVDVLLYRAGENPSSGLSRDPLRPLGWRRVAAKLAGFWLTISTIGIAYAVLSEYARELYTPFKDAMLFLLPGVAAVSPFYIAYVDRRQRQPVDAYAELGMLLTGQWPRDWASLKLHVLGWTIKGFFLPLMFAYAHNGLVGMWSRDAIPPITEFGAFFSFAIDTFYLGDVLLAAVAYALTLRLLDSHIRSVEPSVFGWAVCLVCYEPFVTGTLRAYFSYDGDKLYWGDVFSPFAPLYVAWGTAILVLIGIYLWATVAFGLRFSNLTNRGIITSGPYRWVKHPAYLAKNLSWWMISVPFVASGGWLMAVQSSALLLCVNLVYLLRARTEEKHLRSDPAYRDYEACIAARGLFAIVRRAFVRSLARLA